MIEKLVDLYREARKVGVKINQAKTKTLGIRIKIKILLL
jgi:hypothetical protein